MFRFIRPLVNDFIDLLYPTLCLSCAEVLGANEKILCTSCRIQLPETGHHREPYDHTLLNKFAGRVPIQFLASYLHFSKGGIAQKIIHQAKYKGQKEAIKEIASWYGYQLKIESQVTKGIDVIIGVPLHGSRLSQRGYNQADWIAQGLGETLEIPVQTNLLQRTKFKASQTRKNRLERWENVETVFEVANKNEVKDKNILLVDDVLTTGATIEACAIELLKAGCRSVSVLTIAATK